MFSIQASLLRPFAGAGMLAAAAMVAPVAARAQNTAEMALQNRLAPTVYVPNALAFVSSGAFSAHLGAVDGELALLVRTPVVRRDDTDVEPAGVPDAVDGAYALLGRSGSLDRRRHRP